MCQGNAVSVILDFLSCENIAAGFSELCRKRDELETEFSLQE